jgi:hypothetical protein
MPNPEPQRTCAACPQCGNRDLRRRVRVGLLQRFFLPACGYYPWECLSCRKTWMLRARGGRTFRRIWDEFDPEFDMPSAVTQSPEEFERALETVGDCEPHVIHDLKLEDAGAENAASEHAAPENRTPEEFERELQARIAEVSSQLY